MVLGVFSLLHNAIASISDNDTTDHKLILSILDEQCCKAFVSMYVNMSYPLRKPH